MNSVIKRFNQPGQWEIIIPFDNTGEEREWLGILDGRAPGVYSLAVVAEHSVPRTTGKVTVRAVCGAESVVKLKGIIRIGKEAQETNDFLELRVLMLDPAAQAIASPELEILANNVRASHAASVGRVDPAQFLYLQSRGLSKEKAEELIVSGWLGL